MRLAGPMHEDAAENAIDLAMQRVRRFTAQRITRVGAGAEIRVTVG